MERQNGQAQAAGALSLISLVPFSQDPLAFAARQILDHYQDQLPDLADCQILVAEALCATALRSELIGQAQQRGFQALLGPSIETLEQWLSRLTPVTQTVLSRAAQELVLAEALRGAPRIYSDTDPWLLADQLLTLFDQLTRNEISIPEDFDRFHAQLQHSYAVTSPNPSLQQEAYILHTLWYAWKQQLAAGNQSDPASAYHRRLEASLDAPGDSILWLIGFTAVSPSEARWLRTLIERGRARLILHGSARHGGYHPDRPIHDIVALLDAQDTTARGDDFDAFIATVFDPSCDDLRQRAERHSQQYTEDVIGPRLKTFRADNPEQEAQAVGLQIRRWLLDGIQPLAIITEDRRLARRVRALLESSQIELDDTGGWALSTTSAAATLERWLETVEEDFACGPLLDVLKSPFVNFSERDAHLVRVRRLEQDIILHENITRGLSRYRYHLNSRSERLPDWTQPMRRAVHRMLNRLDHAASPLTPLLQGTYPALRYLNALGDSLRELGARACLEQDDAGQSLLQVLDGLQQAAGQSRVRLSWSEFRNWLGRNVERATFRAPPAAGAVRLLTLEQSRLQSFAAAVVAGCSREHMPGSAHSQAFFNQRVRSQLGLPTWSQSLSLKLHHFCRSLQCADRILLTCHRERDGEPVGTSPWLELLEVFYRNAYRRTLDERELGALLAHPQSQAATPDSAALPEQATCPAPQPPALLHPKTWSAYTHQRLIDCPYRFYAADTLNLKAQDEIREALTKSDYGSLVHRIVQAFHSQVGGLPGPWSGPLTESRFEPALQLLKDISNKVFAEAIQDNFQARSWLNQWLAIVPRYLGWEIQRRAQWTLSQVEFNAQRAFGRQLAIKGRIDRIDRCSGATALLDYKTGRPPRTEAVLSGEAVQLPSYALLLDHEVSRLEYLEFRKDGVKPDICAEGDELQQLLAATEERLLQLDDALQHGAALPAWGDAGICSYCEFSGLCRREMWQHGGNGDD